MSQANKPTRCAKPAELKREWFVIDAEDLILGRLATRAAHVLRGKHKATFSPNLDTGDFVVVINAEKVRMSGNKEEQKMYWHHTLYPGGERGIVAKKQRAEHPERIVQHAVKGMLPKGPLGRRMIKKLKVYAGAEHKHTAQQPKPLKV